RQVVLPVGRPVAASSSERVYRRQEHKPQVQPSSYNQTRAILSRSSIPPLTCEYSKPPSTVASRSGWITRSYRPARARDRLSSQRSGRSGSPTVEELQHSGVVRVTFVSGLTQRML